MAIAYILTGRATTPRPSSAGYSGARPDASRGRGGAAVDSVSRSHPADLCAASLRGTVDASPAAEGEATALGQVRGDRRGRRRAAAVRALRGAARQEGRALAHAQRAPARRSRRGRLGRARSLINPLEYERGRPSKLRYIPADEPAVANRVITQVPQLGVTTSPPKRASDSAIREAYTASQSRLRSGCPPSEPTRHR